MVVVAVVVEVTTEAVEAEEVVLEAEVVEAGVEEEEEAAVEVAVDGGDNTRFIRVAYNQDLLRTRGCKVLRSQNLALSDQGKYHLP